MKKIRIRKFDFLIWGIFAILGLLYYKSSSFIYLIIAFPFLLLYFAIWVLRLILFFFGRTKQIAATDIRPEIINTSGWIKCKGVITQILPGHEITKYGKVIAKLVGYTIKLEKYDDPVMVNDVFIDDVITPISQLNIIGINQEVNLLVKPGHQFIAVFDPEIETWLKDENF